jgi:serine protease Do
MKPWRKSLAAVTLAGASVAAGFFGFNFVQNAQFARAEEKVEATREQLSKVEDLATVFRHVGKVVSPSVVNIQVHKSIKGVHRGLPFDDDMLRRFFPDRNGDGQPDLPEGFGDEDGGNFEQVGTGSGVVMEATGGSGYILTNNHVAGGATSMTITLADGREIKNGKVLGTDAKSDLAVIKVNAERLIPAKWGNSDELDQGDWVMAFGSPFGYVGSMTHGIVSALNRQVGILANAQGYENFIQVDAPINPGNSGGPLVNIHGEVIGINTAIASRTGGFQGIGFAIPSNQAKFVYNALKDKGKVTRGWLGVKIQDASAEPDLSKSFGYSGTEGVLVQETFPNTPAYNKLKAGDIVTAMNGKPVKNTQQLRNAIAATVPNTEVTLTVFREGKQQDVRIKVGDQPEDLLAAATGGVKKSLTSNTRGESAAEALGMKLATPTEDMATRFGLPAGKTGAVVTEVAPRSPAAEKGLRPGDLITSVGGKDVTSASEAAKALSKADVKKGVRLYVTSREGSRFVFLQASDQDKSTEEGGDKDKQ